MNRIIWNGSVSQREQDANPSQCYFMKFCKKCQKTVTCTEGSTFETSEGELKFRLKCPICGKVSIVD